jgi:hypothetical protein
MDFTILDGTRATTVAAEISGERIQLMPDALENALGWKLESQGLCRGEVCVPLHGHEERINKEGIDLAAFAERVERPIALDIEERCAALGTPSPVRASAMASLEAPDFTLPDLEGKLHSLSEHRGKKVLLIAYASW